MLKDLIKVANKLDSLKLTKEADLLDSIIKKIAAVSRTEAPSVPKHLMQEVIEDKIKKAELAESERRKGDYSAYEAKRNYNRIESLKTFLGKAGERIFVTKSPSEYHYQIWLEDPLDPASGADPRKQGDGMSLLVEPDEFEKALTQVRNGSEDRGHFEAIKGPAIDAGAILEKVKKEGYGEWQYRGDIHDLGNYIDTSKLI
jgi:hypothetical protein